MEKEGWEGKRQVGGWKLLHMHGFVGIDSNLTIGEPEEVLGDKTELCKSAKYSAVQFDRPPRRPSHNLKTLGEGPTRDTNECLVLVSQNEGPYQCSNSASNGNPKPWNYWI